MTLRRTLLRRVRRARPTGRPGPGAGPRLRGIGFLLVWL